MINWTRVIALAMGAFFCAGAWYLAGWGFVLVMVALCGLLWAVLARDVGEFPKRRRPY